MPDYSKTRIQLRRGTAAELASADPTLGAGEPAFATDTNTLKIGNGSTAYSSLSAITGGGGGGLSDLVDDTTPQLGGNLDLNSNDITGTGDINLTGTIESSSNGTFNEISLSESSSLGAKVVGASNANLMLIAGGFTSARPQIKLFNTGEIEIKAGDPSVASYSNKDITLDVRNNGGIIELTGGDVGIGTDSPDTKLEVDGQITADNIIKLNNSAFATSHAGITNLQTGAAGLSFVTQNGTASSSSLNLLPSFSSNRGITMGTDFAVSTTAGLTMAFDKYASDGDAQTVKQISHCVTTDGSTTKELTTNNDSVAVGYDAGTANSTGINIFSIPFARTATFILKLTGHNQTDGSSACYIYRGAARNNAATAGANVSTESMALVGTMIEESFVDSGMTGVSVTVAATSVDDKNTGFNDQYGRISVKVVGLTSKTIHWVASFDATFSK